jgi:MBG domain (YGX type)
VSSKTPTVSFDAPAQAYYGDPIGAVALHATSRTPGRFSYTAAPVNDVAAMRPVTVDTVLHAGEYDLEAHFTPTAGSVRQTVTVPFVVDPAPLLIEPDNKFMARGQLTPELTWVAAGFVNGDTPHSLLQSPVCSIARGRLRVGGHLIWCEGGGSPDYTISYPRTATLRVLRHPCAPGTSCETDPPPTARQRRADRGLQLICHPAIPRSNLTFVRGIRGVRKGVRKTTWRGRIT